jgi:tRNA modification GTPase
MEDVETICAISSAPGEGGIGIIRMSGPLAHSILKTIFVAKKSRERTISRLLRLGHIVDPESSDKIDEVYVVFMNSPKTYTREDMGEVYAHGGYAVQKRILSLMVQMGARLAEPGEFTKRAFLNGRIDLPQAEAVLDIIESDTYEELNLAVKALRGVLSKKLEGFKRRLRNVLVEVEALIDFPEEDIDIDEGALFDPLGKIRDEMKRLIDSYYEGRAVRQGVETMIIGRTNVGKSSLLNTLIAREKAIVTPLPGTTRDMIEDTIHIKGMKVRIVDTAGIREPRDIVEKEGIERVIQKIPEVDLILWVVDGSRPFDPEDQEINKRIEGRNTIIVINKVDLPQALERDKLRGTGFPWTEVSALNDTGTEALRDVIHGKLIGKRRRSSLLITNLRHKTGLVRAHDALDRAIVGNRNKVPIEFTAFDLREAIYHLGEIIGESCSEEILHEIFHRFCIGK